MAYSSAGAALTIAYALLLHFTINNVVACANLFSFNPRYILFSIQGVVFIFYPVIGIIADIKLTRYRMICLSFWITFVLHIILLLGPILSYATAERNDIVPLFQMNIRDFCLSVTVGLTFIGATCAKGMFESTAIQFGIDQMIGASSSQISTFIHWYYWSLHVGPVVIHILALCIQYYLSKCYFNYDRQIYITQSRYLSANIVTIQSVIQCFLCSVMLPLLLLKKFKSCFTIEPAGHNPFKHIIDVLKYACKHKYPIRRSSLTYYHNNYLSRIDFGKTQYGGPFTNEQVENTKTLFCLLILLSLLFGFNLSNEYSFSLTGHILNKACPSSLILYFFISNPSLFSDVITTLIIPIVHCVKNRKYFPNMMKRMWFGMLLLLMQQSITFIIGTQIELSTCDDDRLSFILFNYSNSFEICYYSLLQYNINVTGGNISECDSICPPSSFTMDDKLVWLLIPQLLYGFGYMLVFMTTLEFICAQAPYTLKGFMIGIWYCMFSIKYILVGNVDYYIYDKEETAWIIYESIKIGMMGLSVITFGVGCRWYRYRERDEVVNVQGMIENIFEKELSKQQQDEDSDEESLLSESISITYHTFN